MSTFPSSSDQTALPLQRGSSASSSRWVCPQTKPTPSPAASTTTFISWTRRSHKPQPPFEAAAGLQRDRLNWLDLKHAIEAQDAGRILALQAALQQPFIYQAMAPRATTAGPALTTSGPEFMHQVYTLEADGSYQPLEKQEASNTSSGGGYGGSAERSPH